MAQRLGVSDQRASQIVQRLWCHRDRCRPPDGIWMPQVAKAERSGRPNGFTEASIAVARRFCAPLQQRRFASVSRSYPKRCM